VAKVARDEIMENYDRLYPEYGFRQNKGYGSSTHLAALNRHGPSPIHRRSFKPVRECVHGGISSQQSVFNLKNKS
jgi:ribonuclease HII